MEAESLVFNDKYRSETPDSVYILLDISPEKINIGILNMIYEQIIDTQMKTTIFYNSKAYNMLNMLDIFKTKNSSSDTTNMVDNIKYIANEFINNKNVRIDNYLNVIILSDFTDIYKEEFSELIKKLERGFMSRDEDKTYTKNIDMTTILYDVDITTDNLEAYMEVFEDHDLFKIDASEALELKQQKLKATFDQTYNTIFELKRLKTASNLKISFMKSDISITCDVYELGRHNLLSGQSSYKTKLYERGNPEKGEVTNKRFNSNPQTNERLQDAQVKSYYQLATDNFISVEEADKIFQNQVFIGEKTLIEDNSPFLSVIGFASLDSYKNIASLINISKALELKPSNDAKSESLLYDLKSEMVDSETVMLCIGKTIASKEIRNCVVVAKQIDSLDPEDNIRLFVLELPFKDEIRMFPKCAVNEDYKTSPIEADYYSEFKKIFENIFVGDKNMKISQDDFQTLIAEYNSKDVNTKKYEGLLRKKTFVMVEEEPEGIDDLDDTYGLVEQRNEYLHAGYADELEIMHGINSAYYKQHQHVESRKRAPKTSGLNINKKIKK